LFAPSYKPGAIRKDTRPVAGWAGTKLDAGRKKHKNPPLFTTCPRGRDQGCYIIE